MKKISLVIISSVLILILSACENTDSALDGHDHILSVDYLPIYDNVEFIDSTATGIPTSYEELQDYLMFRESVNFVEYEIVSQYSAEEALSITGNDVFLTSSTLYQAHIYYDCLNDVPVDIMINLAKAGTSEIQVKNDPLYTVGQRLVSPVFGFGTSWCVALPELVYYVYNVNDAYLAYHVGHEDIQVQDAELNNIDLYMSDTECSVVTSTGNNPVSFTQKSTVEDLGLFFRNDWLSRGYVFQDFNNLPNNVEAENVTGESMPIDQTPVIDEEDIPTDQ